MTGAYSGTSVYGIPASRITADEAGAPTDDFRGQFAAPEGFSTVGPYLAHTISRLAVRVSTAFSFPSQLLNGYIMPQKN